MAKETALTLWIGTDHDFAFHIKDAAEAASVDITGYALSFMIKTSISDADAAALLTKTTVAGIVIAGTFNSDPAVNAQRATVSIADTDTDALSNGNRRYELKRTDAGSETILAYGALTLSRGVHRT